MDDWIFREAPDVDSDVYLPADLYRRNAEGIAGYLFSGAMARESLWILARSIPPLQPVVARLTNGVLFKFPIPDVDDINTLRADFDVPDSTTRKTRWPPSGVSPIPGAVTIWRKGTTMTPWFGASSMTGSA